MADKIRAMFPTTKSSTTHRRRRRRRRHPPQNESPREDVAKIISKRASTYKLPRGTSRDVCRLAQQMNIGRAICELALEGERDMYGSDLDEETAATYETSIAAVKSGQLPPPTATKHCPADGDEKAVP